MLIRYSAQLVFGSWPGNRIFSSCSMPQPTSPDLTSNPIGSPLPSLLENLPMQQNAKILKVVDCLWCGEDHTLTFLPMTTPDPTAPLLTHWADCPETDIRIYAGPDDKEEISSPI